MMTPEQIEAEAAQQCDRLKTALESIKKIATDFYEESYDRQLALDEIAKRCDDAMKAEANRETL